MVVSKQLVVWLMKPKNPEKTFPKGIIFSAGIIFIGYLQIGMKY